MIIGLAPAALTLFLGHGLPLRNLAVPALISALFAALAWVLRGATVSGAIAGFGVAYALFVEGGWSAFLLLFFVFVVTWAATRLGRARRPGADADRRGRTAAQVVANVGLAAILLVANSVKFRFGYLILIPMTSVLAEAAADTAASEIGKAYGGRTVLITSFRVVPPGTDGGVSLLGSVTALVASALTAAVGYLLGCVPWALLAVSVALSALLATFVDSFLGATLERRGCLNNDGVNLISTVVAAALSFAALSAAFHLGPWR